jgi:CRP-like cAMP-binding protein
MRTAPRARSTGSSLSPISPKSSGAIRASKRLRKLAWSAEGTLLVPRLGQERTPLSTARARIVEQATPDVAHIRRRARYSTIADTGCSGCPRPQQSSALTHILVRKLEGFGNLSAEDREAVEILCADTRSFEAGTDLVREGDHPTRVFVLIEGWACRYKLLADGGQQILAYLIPGDLCDSYLFILKRMDHGVRLLSRARVAVIAPEALLAVTADHPAVQRAVWWATLVDEAILREWLISLGQRDAYERIAHILYEMWRGCVRSASPRIPGRSTFP